MDDLIYIDNTLINHLRLDLRNITQ